MDLVSIIIPSFNRFKYLLNAIDSVLSQTYKNIEIIIVNDCSTEEDYYNFNFKEYFGDNVFIVHLPRNSRSYLGKVCGGGHARNIGIMLSKGKYIGFLDDDDYFLSTKVEKQINAMKQYNCKMSCTEGYIGNGIYNPENTYKVFHYKGYYWNGLLNHFKNKPELLKNMYKNEINIWDKEAIYTHNATIGGSSIIINSDLISKVGYFPISGYAEDWYYWKELIKHTNCVALRESLVYIDNNHGNGRCW
uniref:Glycosyltransferase 2-like domain-containing protein n=1 Tax=viral metagenome TaxID=1070528 RepID=A0A6C0AXZ4_9ZZZZ|tara:strand:+ start:4010 stop:4750 length:741 start_codon:yes stop_codon:yes gene_type:complete